MDRRFVGARENLKSERRGIPKESYLSQVGALHEYTTPDAGNAVRKRDTGQTGGRKCKRSNLPNTVGDRDADQCGALPESSLTDTGNTIGNRDAS